MLSIIDLYRQENCYICNIVKCRPPRNRDPLETEQDACIGFLRNQVALVRPKIIVCLGRIAAKRLIDPEYLSLIHIFCVSGWVWTAPAVCGQKATCPF